MPTYLSEIVIFDTNYIFKNNLRKLSAISILYLGKRGKLYLRLCGSVATWETLWTNMQTEQEK